MVFTSYFKAGQRVDSLLKGGFLAVFTSNPLRNFGAPCKMHCQAKTTLTTPYSRPSNFFGIRPDLLKSECGLLL